MPHMRKTNVQENKCNTFTNYVNFLFFLKIKHITQRHNQHNALEHFEKNYPLQAEILNSHLNLHQVPPPQKKLPR